MCPGFVNLRQKFHHHAKMVLHKIILDYTCWLGEGTQSPLIAQKHTWHAQSCIEPGWKLLACKHMHSSLLDACRQAVHGYIILFCMHVWHVIV